MTSLKLEIKDVAFVKPSKPTPPPFSIISLSTIDNRPELNTLCQTIHVYQSPKSHDFPNSQLDPALVIKEALSKALSFYHPLAGKLVKHADGKLRVHCNGDGVPFVEAIANCNLSSLHYLDGNDIEIAKLLAFDLPNSLVDDENGHQYPLGFKLTKFQCGGFTVGIGASHAVFDGSGASQFFRAISELASGKTEPSLKPVWEREKLVGSITKQPLQFPIDEDSAAISPFLPTKALIHEYFEVDNKSIERLKLSLMNEIINNDTTIMKEEIRFTNFECLGAYVWRSRSRALKLNHDGKTSLGIVIGIKRHLLEPPLPEGYYRNSFIDPKIVLEVRELNEGPLSNVVKIIKETKKNASTRDYIRKSIDTLETKLDNKVGYFQGIGASMVLSNWIHLGMLENSDFGCAKPVNVVPVPSNMFGSVGMCIFSPPSNLDPSMNGGVRILVSLPSEAMPNFREEMEALKLIAPLEDKSNGA